MAAMSVLALRDDRDADVKPEDELLPNDVRQQVSKSPEIPQAEAGHSAQDMLESRFADYQLRAETHMEAQRRQHLDEMAAFEKEFQTLRLERDQEREANKNLQSFFVGRLRKQAERQGVYDNGLKPAPEVVTQVYANSDSTAGKPVSSGVNTGDPHVLIKQMVRPEAKTLYATQTQVALRDLDETKEDVARAATAKASTTTAVKTEATTDVRKAPAEGKPHKRSSRKPDQGKKEPPKDNLKKKSTPPSQLTVKHGPPDNERSDDDNDSEKESGDSDSDSSSFEDLASGTQARATSQGAIMFNPMVNITALKDFDEKQPLAVRTRWLEKFQSLAVMGRWSDHVKVYYCKLKLSSAVRDWPFREEYCKAKTLDSEYYYTTFQRKSETPREFYYRLNKIAGKADIDVKSTDIARDRHLKVFIKKLKDTQLRSALQGQRVRSLKDLKHILMQHEEIWWSDDREAHPPKGNDRKAEGAFGNRQRQKNHSRVYTVNEDETFANDDEQQVLFDEGAGSTHPKVLKLKLKFGKQISVSGLGGVPTSITASAEVKITLGPRVVYVVDVWVANIGGGLDYGYASRKG
ncbi:hypothetical protein PHMEG_00024428 [Phytophthora megakarya]|uniref:Retrotransposon gag domain-containing protein n=1 Tax=Phytophthora megakarya TaxID=4795 RepID=A0A225VEH0_9STRA|nr:hypothetical protein PHMEG_00024428 [Phytophthora megakarya]